MPEPQGLHDMSIVMSHSLSIQHDDLMPGAAHHAECSCGERKVFTSHHQATEWHRKHVETIEEAQKATAQLAELQRLRALVESGQPAPPAKVRRVWDCKIGGNLADLPDGADLPMRHAVERAYREITGHDPEFLFSGWGGRLDDIEASVVDAREKGQ